MRLHMIIRVCQLKQSNGNLLLCLQKDIHFFFSPLCHCVSDAFYNLWPINFKTEFSEPFFFLTLVLNYTVITNCYKELKLFAMLFLKLKFLVNVMQDRGSLLVGMEFLSMKCNEKLCCFVYRKVHILFLILYVLQVCIIII